MRTGIVERALDSCALLAEVAQHRNGATVVFVGTVRDVNAGAEVSGLDYSAYSAMAAQELDRIAREACERWQTPDVVVEHRIGTLELGDASVVIAVGHPHRGEAFEAARYVIEELKKRLPIWKRERYLDGRSEWVAGSDAAAMGNGLSAMGKAHP